MAVYYSTHRYIPDDMEIIDGMPASKPKSPAQVRAPWED